MIIDRPVFSEGDLVSERFRIVTLLGTGGMGEVYEAEDLVLHRERVALKTLPSHIAADERSIERLKREIALARLVTHPNVCRVFDVFQHQRTTSGAPITFFTMELLKGPTLLDRLRERGTMTTAEALPLVKQMAAALGAAHAAGIVHGDFKPGNVMLVPTGSGTGRERVVVTDFGLAHPVAMDATDMATMTASPGWGTPAYMPPEQIVGDRLTPKTDIFAMGAVVQQMIPTLPIGALATAVDLQWRAAMRKCLERDPADRFKNVDEFIRELERPHRPGPWSLRPGAPSTGRPRAGPLRRLLVVAAALAVFATLAILAWPPARARLFATLNSAAGLGGTTTRRVALLPFTEAKPTADTIVFGRGLAAILAEQLRMAATAEGVDNIRVLPAQEVLEAGVLTPVSVQRTLGANLIVAGRLARGDRGAVLRLTVDDTTKTVPVARRAQTFGAMGGDQVMLPAALAHVAQMLGLTLSPATIQLIAQGGTRQARAEDFYIRGRGHLSSLAIDAAVESLQRAVEADASFALAHAALSEAWRAKYRASRDPAFIERAQREGDEAIALNPSAAYAHVIRALVYRETGQNARAIRELRTALDADADALDARQGLAEAYEAEGSVADAENNYRKEIASYPQYWLPYVNLGSFLIKRGRYAEAETNLLTGVQFAPDNARAIGNLAGLYILTDRFAAAETELQRGIALSPSVIAYNNLAWVYIFQKQFDKAVPLMEKAVKMPRADSTHWGNLARVYRWTNQASLARSAYDTAVRMALKEIAVNPSDARIHANLACLLAETGRRTEALVEMASTIERAPNDVSVLFRSALVNELTGNRAAALDALEAAARGGHSSADIRRHPDLAQLQKDPRYLQVLAAVSKPAAY